MLKDRLVACLAVRDGIVVQSFGFERWLAVGTLAVAVEFLDRWGIDEVVITDIGAARTRQPMEPALLRSALRRCFVPVTVGGGIASLDHIRKVMHAGADKVALNTAALAEPELITKGAQLFGSQCMVVSIDVRRTGDGWEVFSHGGTVATGRSPDKWAEEVERRGAGEILINSIDQDGTYAGYDLGLIRVVDCAVRIPIIACGGAGTPGHFQAGLDAGAKAVAAGNLFHHTEHTAVVAKTLLAQRGINVRATSLSGYVGSKEDERGRPKAPSNPLPPNCNYRPE